MTYFRKKISPAALFLTNKETFFTENGFLGERAPKNFTFESVILVIS